MSENLKLKKVNKSFVPEKRVVSVSDSNAYEHYKRFMHVNILVVFLDLYILQSWNYFFLILTGIMKSRKQKSEQNNFMDTSEEKIKTVCPR